MPEKVGKFIELPVELVAEVMKLCAKHDTTFTAEVVDALRRHLAYPPKREPEPLPDAEKSRKSRRG